MSDKKEGKWTFERLGVRKRRNGDTREGKKTQDRKRENWVSYRVHVNECRKLEKKRNIVTKKKM